MTDEAAEKKPIPNSENDWVLQELVDIVNRADIGVGVTLVVQGAIVSGQLISFRKFYEEYGNQWMDGAKGADFAKQIRDRWVETGKEQFDELNAEETYNPPTYIHLKDAKYYLGLAPIPGGPGFLWRGRLSEVGAFSMGQLGQQSKNP